jgi:hypothetical protein
VITESLNRSETIDLLKQPLDNAGEQRLHEQIYGTGAEL